MKRWGIVLGIVFSGALSQAQSQSPSPTPEISPAPVSAVQPSPAPTPSETPTLTPVLVPQPQASAQPRTEAYKYSEPKEHRLRLAISPYYGLGQSLQADSISINNSGTQTWGSGNFPTNTEPGIAIELYDNPQHSFGWSAGVSYDFQRTINGLNAADSSGNQIGSPFNTPRTGLSFLTVYGNGLYRFDSTYVGFGINYTFPNLQGGTNNFGSTSLVGGVGIQAGGGVNLSDTFALELWIQELSLNGNTNTSTSSLIYYNLYFFNPQLRLRISF